MKRSMMWGGLAVGGVALTLSACAEYTHLGRQNWPTRINTSTTTTTQVTPMGLQNTTWRLVEVNGRPVDSAASISVDRAGKRFNGSGGCNTIMGGVKTTRSNGVSFTNVASTMMACPDDAKNQTEMAFMDALNKATSYRIENGKLQLLSSAGAVLATLAQ